MDFYHSSEYLAAAALRVQSRNPQGWRRQQGRCSGTPIGLSRIDRHFQSHPIAWWFDPAPVTLGRYGSHPDFPAAGSPGPTNRGNNFFLGGLGTNHVISQTIDLTTLGADIDDPGVAYAFSGFLGGAGTNAASATVAARFLDATGAVLGARSIGPVTAAERGGVTGLLERNAMGSLPVGTRRVEFVVAMSSPRNTNDASADNLSFVLTPVPDSPPVILTGNFSNQTWQVQFQSRTNRLYALERSAELRNWIPATPVNPGTGAFMTLSDTNPPPGQAFYRLDCRRP